MQDDHGGLPVLEPMPYHVALADLLEEGEAEAWAWFAEDLGGPEHNAAVRLELLKATYRIERDSHPELYGLSDRVGERLGVSRPVTLYQMQRSGAEGLNAALFYLPGEVHIAFVGSILESLQTDEIVALLGHEMAHFLLLEGWNGRYRVLEELLYALAQDQGAQPAHGESYRLFHLYKEVFCDRGALRASCDLNSVVTMLLKVETGVHDVEASSYFRQMDEIFANDGITTEGRSHPESFVRVRALKLWSEDPGRSEAAIRRIIERGKDLESMDLLGQREAYEQTKVLIGALLAHDWMRTDTIMAHARLFFSDFSPPSEPPPNEAIDRLRESALERLGEFYSYTLLDFAACDRDLEEPALAAALLLSRRLNLEEAFLKLAMKELKLKKRQCDVLAERAEELVAAAQAAGSER